MKKSVTDKRENQRQKILQIAFKEWGKNNFCHTSLSSLAKRLGITKPALYRYFPSKDELLNEMRNHFMTDYLELFRSFLKNTTAFELPEAISLLIELHYNFFHSHPAYYIFLMRQGMQGTLFTTTQIAEQFGLLAKNIQALASRQNHNLSECEVIISIRYLITTIIYWLAPLFMEKAAQHIFFTNGQIPSPDELKQKTLDYCLTGLLNCQVVSAKPVTYEQIEYNAQTGPGQTEILPEDRLYGAIEAVVSQSGLEEASIDKIAVHLGMTKSSLYFYFKNKDDMLGQMMQRKQDLILRYLQQKIQTYEWFTDQSYAFMNATASKLLERPVMLTIFNWLRFQNIKLNLKPPNKEYLKNFFNFVIAAAEAGQLKIQPEEALRAGVFLHVLTFSAVLEHKGQPEAREELFKELRLLHHYYLYGFPGTNLS